MMQRRAVGPLDYRRDRRRRWRGTNPFKGGKRRGLECRVTSRCGVTIGLRDTSTIQKGIDHAYIYNKLESLLPGVTGLGSSPGRGEGVVHLAGVGCTQVMFAVRFWRLTTHPSRPSTVSIPPYERHHQCFGVIIRMYVRKD